MNATTCKNHWNKVLLMHAFIVLCAKFLPYHLNEIYWSGKGFLSLSWPKTDDSAETGSPVLYSMPSAVAPGHMVSSCTYWLVNLRLALSYLSFSWFSVIETSPPILFWPLKSSSWDFSQDNNMVAWKDPGRWTVSDMRSQACQTPTSILGVSSPNLDVKRHRESLSFVWPICCHYQQAIEQVYLI